MDEIGLFPLELVLLPTERVPLHVFEPRYRELVGECLASGTEFGLVLAAEDRLAEIGTRARVVEVLRMLDDGRMDVVVEGGERFRLLTLTEGRSFRTAEVEPVEDEDDPPAREDAALAVERFRRLAEVAGSDVDVPAEDAPVLSFELAARVDFGAQLKQELLELRSERRRLRRLARLLARATDALVLSREIGERASRNGKVDRRR